MFFPRASACRSFPSCFAQQLLISLWLPPESLPSRKLKTSLPSPFLISQESLREAVGLMDLTEVWRFAWGLCMQERKTGGRQHMTITNTASLQARVSLSASHWHLLPVNQSLFSHLCLSLSPHSLVPLCYLLPSWGNPKSPQHNKYASLSKEGSFFP